MESVKGVEGGMGEARFNSCARTLTQIRINKFCVHAYPSPHDPYTLLLCASVVRNGTLLTCVSLSVYASCICICMRKCVYVCVCVRVSRVPVSLFGVRGRKKRTSVVAAGWVTWADHIVPSPHPYTLLPNAP